MNHSQLVEKARTWLIYAQQCNPVFTEKGSSKSKERPDAIGWTSKGSIVVECKVSVADFKLDKKKSFRKNIKKGMGKFRYFLMIPELYQKVKEDIPKGWGVVTCQDDHYNPRKVHLSFSKVFKYSMKAELYYMRNRVFEIQNFGK